MSDLSTMGADPRHDGHTAAPRPPHGGAWEAVARAHAAVSQRLGEALTEAGLPPLSWYEALDALTAAPEGRMRMGDLAEALVISRGGLTKLVDRLVKAGLLERSFCESDRRVSYATLCPAGLEMHAEMEPVVAAEIERTFAASLSDRQAEALRTTLDRVCSSACAGDA